jgi:hypothetical protein
MKKKVINETDISQEHVQKGLKAVCYIQLMWYIMTLCALLHQLLQL